MLKLMYVLIGTARYFLSQGSRALFPTPPCEQGLQSLTFPRPCVSKPCSPHPVWYIWENLGEVKKKQAQPKTDLKNKQQHLASEFLPRT